MSATEYDARDAHPPTDASAPAVPTHSFNFTGTGSEYSRIWIVNLLLSLVTLGIYSAWAKVRTERYLYGHTEVAGGRFEYHGEPIPILKGRLLAVGLLLIYVLASEFVPLLGAALAIVLLIATPVIIVRAFSFNARMSSWRGIRFGFDGTVGEAASSYLLMPIVGLLTLGLAFPYVWYRQAAFNVDGHRFGQTPFKMGATAGDFYKFAFILSGFSILFVVFFSVLGGFSMATSSAPGAAAGSGVLVLVVLGIAAYAVLVALYTGLRFRAMFTDLQLGDNRVNNDVSIGRFVFIVVTNSIGLLLTLGLFYPWAKIRMTRFLMESLTLEAVDLDNFVAAAESDTNAVGEELSSAFDLGVGI